MRSIAGAIIVTGIFTALPLLATSAAGDASVSPPAARLERGRALAFDRSKGNCLACHAIEGGALPGNIGPPLLAMKQRFPDEEQLRAQIRDAGVRNPETIMPPFGRHRILTDEEIDLVVDFLYTL